MKRPKLRQTTVRLPVQLIEDLDALAEREMTNRTQLLIRIMREYVAKKEWEG